MKMLAKAIAIAARAHEGQLDKGGNPYILHPLWVMEKVKHLGEDYMIVAVLHDVIEDTDISVRYLQELGFNETVLEALQLLNFYGVDYDTQIQKLYYNPIAREVKMRDIEHNSMVTRLKGLRKKDFLRLEKYHKAYVYLSN